MSNPREDTGYTPTERSKERVSISDYGKKAKAEKAKIELRLLIEKLKAENEGKS